MKRLALVVIAAMVAIGTATSVIRSHALLHLGQAGMPSIQELQSKSGNLPAEDVDDRSLVFPRHATP